MLLAALGAGADSAEPCSGSRDGLEGQRGQHSPGCSARIRAGAAGMTGPSQRD